MCIRDRPGLVGRRGAFVPHQRLINAGAMHVAAQYGVGAVVFGNQVRAVIEQIGHRPAKGGLAQPPFAVVGQGRGITGLVGALQAVVEVVAISPDAVADQVAVTVVADAGACLLYTSRCV